MSQHKIIHSTAYFRREGGGSSQTVRPSLISSDLIGNVVSLSLAKEAEEAVFEKSVGGKIVDYDAVNQRDRETFTVTCNELSELAWELVRGVSVALAGGSASYTPGSTITTKGWLRVVSTDDAAATIDDVSVWCKADITTQEHPQLGYVQAVFVCRKLYSTQNTGQLTNIS